MDDLKRQFILIVQTQCVILDIKKNRTESLFAMRDAFNVNDEKMRIAIDYENKELLDLVKEFMDWQYYSEPKPSWC